MALDRIGELYPNFFVQIFNTSPLLSPAMAARDIDLDVVRKGVPIGAGIVDLSNFAFTYKDRLILSKKQFLKGHATYFNICRK